jgi:hypothetical protein
MLDTLDAVVTALAIGLVLGALSIGFGAVRFMDLLREALSP